MHDAKTTPIAYAWSKRGEHYFVTTCRSAETNEEKNFENLEDDFVDVTHKDISRPYFFHLPCKVLPIKMNTID